MPQAQLILQLVVPGALADKEGELARLGFVVGSVALIGRDNTGAEDGCDGVPDVPLLVIFLGGIAIDVGVHPHAVGGFERDIFGIGGDGDEDCAVVADRDPVGVVGFVVIDAD